MRFWAMGCAAGLMLCLAACEGEKKSAQGPLPPPLVSVLELKRADVPLYSVFMGQIPLLKNGDIINTSWNVSSIRVYNASCPLL